MVHNKVSPANYRYFSVVWIRKSQLQLLYPYCFVLPLYLYIKSDLSGFMKMRSYEISHRFSNEKSFWKFEKIPKKIPRRSRIFREVTIFLRPPLHNHFCWVLVNKWFIQVFFELFCVSETLQCPSIKRSMSVASSVGLYTLFLQSFLHTWRHPCFIQAKVNYIWSKGKREPRIKLRNYLFQVTVLVTIVLDFKANLKNKI